MRSKLYVIHNTTDKVARVKVSLHLNAFACQSPIKERKWGWIWRVSPGRVPPSKATFRQYYLCVQLCRLSRTLWKKRVMQIRSDITVVNPQQWRKSKYLLCSFLVIYLSMCQLISRSKPLRCFQVEKTVFQKTESVLTYETCKILRLSTECYYNIQICDQNRQRNIEWQSILWAIFGVTLQL